MGQWNRVVAESDKGDDENYNDWRLAMMLMAIMIMIDLWQLGTQLAHEVSRSCLRESLLLLLVEELLQVPAAAVLHHKVEVPRIRLG